MHDHVVLVVVREGVSFHQSMHVALNQQHLFDTS